MSQTVTSVENFVKRKSAQLVYFVRGFLDEQIPYSELELFLWDILEEWAQLQVDPHQRCPDNERVFWHLINQLKFWPEHHLRQDLYLRAELLCCLDYLDGNGSLPIDCVGIRP